MRVRVGEWPVGWVRGDFVTVLKGISVLFPLALLMASTPRALTQESTPQANAPKQAISKVSADEVCSFITDKVRAAVPQVPTLCIPRKSNPNSLSYEVNVFSPTDVLDGKLRRAWSTGIFMAAQQLFVGGALNGICQSSSEAKDANWFGCTLSISDSQMSQYGMRYDLMSAVSHTVSSVLSDDPASEDWYKTWWFLAQLGTTFDRPGSANNAESIGKEACIDYEQTIMHDSFIGQLKQGHPACSILLATDTSIYLTIDFSDFFSPSFVNYALPLVTSFGKPFANSPYDGEVIFKSPWKTIKDGSTLRALWAYDLRNLEFLWREMNSGVRSDAEVSVVGAGSAGQTDLHSFSGGSDLGAIFKITAAADGRTLIDMTNGSTWAIPKSVAIECAVRGSKLLLGNTESGPTLLGPKGCDLPATFVGSW